MRTRRNGSLNSSSSSGGGGGGSSGIGGSSNVANTNSITPDSPESGSGKTGTAAAAAAGIGPGVGVAGGQRTAAEGGTGVAGGVRGRRPYLAGRSRPAMALGQAAQAQQQQEGGATAAVGGEATGGGSAGVSGMGGANAVLTTSNRTKRGQRLRAVNWVKQVCVCMEFVALSSS